MVAVIPLTILAADAAGGTGWLLALLPVLLGGGILGAVFTHRSQNRKTDAEAGSIIQETYQDALKDLRDQMSALRDDARGARAEAAGARAEAAAAKEEATKAVLAQQRAETRSAETDAELARAEQRAGEERHKLRNELAAVAAKRDTLQHELEEMRITHNAEIQALNARHDREIASLRADIATLRAAAGLSERRVP